MSSADNFANSLEPDQIRQTVRPGPQGGGGGCEITKLFSCSKSIEHEILAAHKTKILKIKTFIAFRLSDVVLILLINVKMPTIVGILTLMSKINFMLT